MPSCALSNQGVCHGPTSQAGSRNSKRDLQGMLREVGLSGSRRCCHAPRLGELCLQRARGRVDRPAGEQDSSLLRGDWPTCLPDVEGIWGGKMRGKGPVTRSPFPVALSLLLCKVEMSPAHLGPRRGRACTTGGRACATGALEATVLPAPLWPYKTSPT